MQAQPRTIVANEIEPNTKRRKFSPAHKARIIAEADKLLTTEPKDLVEQRRVHAG